MKYLISLLLLLTIGFFAFANKEPLEQALHKVIYSSLCDNPVTYRIDTVDARFGLSRDDFIRSGQQAADIWNTAEGKNLLAYDPNSKLRVSLIYDERQSLNNQINNLQNQLTTEQQNLAPQIQEYKQLEADFKQKLGALNAQITEWNNKGGAPPDVYAQLIKQQQDLKNEGAQLNLLAQRLNQSTDTYNTQVGQLNQTVQNFNQELQLKPEEGLYNGRNNTITIYFDTNQNELIHTLAHEFGHALGLSHVADPQAIMYAYTTKTLTLSQADRAQLQALCRERSIVEIVQDEFQILVSNIQLATGR